MPCSLACPTGNILDKEHCVGLDADHSNMCKFSDKDDPNFQNILSCLQRIYRKRFLAVANWVYHEPNSGRDLSCHSSIAITNSWLTSKSIVLSNSNIDQINFEIPMDLPYGRNKYFVGREVELAQIHRALFAPNHSSRGATVLLHGIGGIGKSQIALEYAYRNRAEFSSVFWVDARDQWSLHASYLSIMQSIVDRYMMQFGGAKHSYSLISRYLGLRTVLDENCTLRPDCGPTELIKEALTDWLSRRNNNRWLLIFDSVNETDKDHSSQQFSYIPWGRTIYTSRSKSSTFSSPTVEIFPMSTSDSRVLFFAHSEQDLNFKNIYGKSAVISSLKVSY